MSSYRKHLLSVHPEVIGRRVVIAGYLPDGSVGVEYEPIISWANYECEEIDDDGDKVITAESVPMVSGGECAEELYIEGVIGIDDPRTGSAKDWQAMAEEMAMPEVVHVGREAN